MGISTHVYSYWGVRTAWNGALFDAHEDIYEQAILPDDDAEVLMDCMSAEYMVFGVRLYDSGNSRWGEMINSSEIDISDQILEDLKQRYMTNFKKLYPNQYDWLAQKKWKLVNLVHYT